MDAWSQILSGAKTHGLVLIAIGCVIVAIIIALGVVFQSVEVVPGGAVIAGLLSAFTVVEIIKVLSQ